MALAQRSLQGQVGRAQEAQEVEQRASGSGLPSSPEERRARLPSPTPHVPSSPPSLRARASGRASLLLDNRSGYDTSDLRRFFLKGLRSLGVKQPKHIIVVAAPARSRGCAEIGTSPAREGVAIVIAMAPPSRFRLRRLARLFEHEVGHTHGLVHETMAHDVMWSLGPVPAWARGSVIRYRGRAQDQLP